MIDENKFWEEAITEFESLNRKKGLWAKCLAQNEGDENKAKFQYLREKVKSIREHDLPQKEERINIEIAENKLMEKELKVNYRGEKKAIKNEFEFLSINLLSLVIFVPLVYYLSEILTALGQKNYYVQTACITEPIFFIWCLIVMKKTWDLDATLKPIYAQKLITYIAHIYYMLIIILLGTFMANIISYRA